ncbi:hypothetical protein BGZ83_009092 [Gryganskiella cystojenkinii]|nr:hypothetical protein BGZ83_009092 [Gryganskiella cystojenkinii]
MPLPARDALMQAKTSIKAAREGSEDAVITHYRAAKNALAEVDIKKTDTAALREMIAAFQDLAVVLDNSGAPRKADKCRQRADTLWQKLDGGIKVSAATNAPSLVGSGFRQAIVQAGVVLLNPLAMSSSSSSSASTVASNTSAATSIRVSVATAVVTTPTPQRQALPSSQAAIQASPLFFRKDVNPVLFNCQLPRSNELLQTTRQLAYCLALLQASVQDDDLPPDTLMWRKHTLINSDEKDRLETLSVQIIQKFAKDTMKDAAAVVEVVQLAPVLNSDHSRFLLKTFIDTVDKSEMLHLHSVDGLAKAIQGAAPGSIDSNDLVSILRSLYKRLRPIHSASQHQYHLLVAVSRVLDAMVDAHIGDVDRAYLHGPLTDFLRESEANENPYLAFQAAYATQALLNVSDDENIWHAGFRRGWLVLKGGAGFAKMPDPKEIKDALEGLERLYEAGKGGVRMFKDASEAIKNHESPTFTVKEGLKFRRAWYRAVRTAESYLQTGRLVQFEDLVTTTSCRHQLMFQWGICQFLGRFAADTYWDLEARQNAVAFLGALCRTDKIWNRQKEVDRVVFDLLTNVVSNNHSHFEDAKTLLEEMGKQNTALISISNLQQSPWINIPVADPPGNTTPLLKAVQDRNRQHAKIENLPDLPPQPSRDNIQSALKTYHAPDLFILRVSGQELDLETCFVNLAIVEAPAHRKKEKQDLKEKAAVFHRIPSFERVENADTQSLIPLEQLFNKRKLPDGTENVPKRILVQGRAGIGKTTLCKKLVHAHQNGLWRTLFDAILWLPLRHLRGSKSRTLECLFREKVFIAQNLDQEQEALAHSLAFSAQEGKVLFILDGLDELVTDAGGDESKDLRSFLKTLLGQQHVVITSRPSGLDHKLLPPIDLELETVGFSQQNVKDFLVKVLEPEAAETVQDFIRRTPLIQGLVNIPVQLDVICFSWDSLPRDGPAITMTGLYQLMVRNLWRKDALLLKKTAGGKDLTERQISQLAPEDIDELMTTELQHLGYLAFKGLDNKHQIEFNEKDLLCAFRDLRDHAGDKSRLLPPQLVEIMKQTSFLHTTDTDLDSRNGGSRQAWHFLHLTFQEYFAATWIVRHFHLKQPSSSTGMMTVERVAAFVQQHKYNPQYEIVWPMVAGLLQGEQPLGDFFELLQGAPRDLIGGRHQQILASCLNEARTRLDSAVVGALDSELCAYGKLPCCEL